MLDLDRLEITYRSWQDSPEPVLMNISRDALALVARVRELEVLLRRVADWAASDNCGIADFAEYTAPLIEAALLEERT